MLIIFVQGLSVSVYLFGKITNFLSNVPPSLIKTLVLVDHVESLRSESIDLLAEGLQVNLSLRLHNLNDSPFAYYNRFDVEWRHLEYSYPLWFCNDFRALSVSRSSLDER